MQRQVLEHIDYALPGSSARFARVTLRRDADGRIASREIHDGLSTEVARYAYDAAGRLLAVLVAGQETERYEYGPRGERIRSRVLGRETEYGYDARLRLVQAGRARYEYDHAGRLTAALDGAGETRYRYTDQGQLAAVLLPDGRRIGYLCDPAGVRVAKAVNGAWLETYSWLDRARLAMVADGQGRRLAFRYGEDGRLTALRMGGMEYPLACDQTGGVFRVVSAGGHEVKRVIYDSFGNTIYDGNPDFPLPLGLAGGLLDRDTGLIHFGWRDYDPALGRFLQPDPLGRRGGDTDLYGYCLDDPVNLIDPLGLRGQAPPQEQDKNKDGQNQGEQQQNKQETVDVTVTFFPSAVGHLAVDVGGDNVGAQGRYSREEGKDTPHWTRSHQR